MPIGGSNPSDHRLPLDLLLMRSGPAAGQPHYLIAPKGVNYRGDVLTSGQAIPYIESIGDVISPEKRKHDSDEDGDGDEELEVATTGSTPGGGSLVEVPKKKKAKA